jgi:hypothetical protein
MQAEQIDETVNRLQSRPTADANILSLKEGTTMHGQLVVRVSLLPLMAPSCETTSLCVMNDRGVEYACTDLLN